MSENMLSALLANGLNSDLRRFFACLGPDDRTHLLTTTVPASDYCPLEASFLFDNDIDRAAVLIDSGPPLDQLRGRRSNPLKTATLAASAFKSTSVLQLVLSKAQAQGCLAAILPHVTIESLSYVFQSDYGEAVDVLLAAGLDIGSIIVDGHGDRSHSPLRVLMRAVERDAVSCLRAFHSRLPADQWCKLLGECVAESALPALLAHAFSNSAYNAFYFLCQAHTTATPDSASLWSAEALTELLARLLSPAALPHDSDSVLADNVDLGIDTDMEGARRTLASWDQQARAELYVAHRLGIAPDTLSSLVLPAILASCGPRLACALLDALHARHGTLDVLLSFRLGRSYPLLLRHPEATGAMVAVLARKEAAQLGSDEVACTAAAAESISAKVGFIQLFRTRNRTSARVLLEAGALLHASECPSTAIETPLLGLSDRPPSEGLAIARACIAALTAEDRLEAHVANFSLPLLRSSLEMHRLSLAQLYIDNGADVFDGHTMGTGLLRVLLTTTPRSFAGLNSVFHGEAAYLRSLGVAEPVTEADAAACQTMAEARAHAVKAAAMEEQLLSAFLRDPHLLDLDRPSFLLGPWLQNLRSALGIRWLWGRMCERDAPCARQCIITLISDPKGRLTPLEMVAAHGNVASARFLVSVGARLTSAAPLADACSKGRYALAWVLIGAALNEDACARASALAGIHAETRGTVLTGLLTAACKGYRFHTGLADAVVAAGAEVTAADVRAACCFPTPAAGAALWLGEPQRALRWALQRVQHQLGTGTV